MFYSFAHFFASGCETKNVNEKNSGRKLFPYDQSRTFLFFMARKLLRRKLTIPRKNDTSPGSLLLRCPWGPLLCIVEFVRRSNLVHRYHLPGIAYRRTTCTHTDYVCTRYIRRICIMESVIRCGLPDYLSFFLFTY